MFDKYKRNKNFKIEQQQEVLQTIKGKYWNNCMQVNKRALGESFFRDFLNLREITNKTCE